MPSGLVRLQQTGHSHFVTFTCYRRSKNMCEADVCAIVLQCLEHARLRYRMCVYGYVLMPEHVHLLVSEPERGTLAQALQSLKSASARVARRGSPASVPRFWQTRYYDRYMRDHEEFVEKLRYIHRNPTGGPQLAIFQLWGMLCVVFLLMYSCVHAFRARPIAADGSLALCDLYLLSPQQVYVRGGRL